MKILLIETQITGHHETYLLGLLRALDPQDDYRVVSPKPFPSIDKGKTFVIPFEKNGRRHYIGWLRQIIKLVRQYRPDLVHFAYGDDLYRFGGFGLERISRNVPVLITFHQIRRSFLRDLSLKWISEKCRTVIVHTAQLSGDLNRLGIFNVHQVEYPQFSQSVKVDRTEALEKLDINSAEGKILLALGGTREDKGLDILLEALKEVKEPFHLIVAGKEEKFTREFVENRIQTYKNRVSLFLEFLPEDRLNYCLNAADLIVLPYRRSFDGASGPLGEGVWLKKEIIGPSHGSLGEIIRSHHLGLIFESEDPISLKHTLQKALSDHWKPDEEYLQYRRELDPERFTKKYHCLYHGGTE